MPEILTATINSQTTNHSLFLPLSFNYEAAKISGMVSASKADAEKILHSINAELSETVDGTTPDDEEFYQKVKRLVSKENKYHFPLTLTLIVVRQTGTLLIFNWGGSVLLRRNKKIGQLTAPAADIAALEVKAGKLKSGDLLVLFNNNSTLVLERIKENLETAQDWADFILFSEAYLSQPDLENLGLVVMKVRTVAEPPVTMSTKVDRGIKENSREQWENQEAQVTRARRLDLLSPQPEAEAVPTGMGSFGSDRENEEEIEVVKEKKVGPWEKLGGLFKKKISR